jgi:hypothetical protein
LRAGEPDLLHVAALVDRVDLDLDRIARRRRRPVGRVRVRDRRRVSDLARGRLIRLTSSFGSLPDAVSTVIGPMPSKMPPAMGLTGPALRFDRP